MGSAEDNNELLIGRGDLRTLAEDKTVPLDYAYTVYKTYFPHGIGSIADVLLDRAMDNAPDDGWFADEDLQKWRRESGT